LVLYFLKISKNILLSPDCTEVWADKINKMAIQRRLLYISETNSNYESILKHKYFEKAINRQTAKIMAKMSAILFIC